MTKSAHTVLECDRRQTLGAAAAFAGLVATAAPALAGRARPVAKTTAGKVRGLAKDGVLVFKGIRYGADTRPNRFQPPHRPKPWHELLEAVEYGPSCPQVSRGEARCDEDCLFLNVWTPAVRDGGRRTVMVYIHGGAYANGSGSDPLTDGTNLVKRGNVVVVTVNHRLNAFGYLYLGGFAGAPYEDSGNAGQLDLILALEWVRDNIAEFGGNPDNVMVFGQSGGGAKIATLMAMPAAKGLFHRAATMSGQQVTASGPLHAAQRAEVFLKALGIDKTRLDDLKSVSTDALVAALRATDPIIGAGGVYFGPVVDMRTLARHPFFPDAPAQSAAIPMMIGNTHDETRAFIQDDWAYSLTWTDLPQRLAANMRVDIAPAYVIEQYRRLFPGLSPTDLFFAATTASRSWRGAIEELQARARAGSPTYAYQIDWRTRLDGGRLGAFHTIDIALAFDNTETPHAPSGPGPESRKMAAIVSETFLAFAISGNPNNSLLPEWRPYSLDIRQTMIFDMPAHLQNDPRGEERRIFEKVPFIQQGT
jgi:para-nitrobenzyl esterase